MFFISTVTSTNVNFNFSKSFREIHFVIDPLIYRTSKIFFLMIKITITVTRPSNRPVVWSGLTVNNGQLRTIIIRPHHPPRPVRCWCNIGYLLSLKLLKFPLKYSPKSGSECHGGRRDYTLDCSWTTLKLFQVFIRPRDMPTKFSE